MGLKSYFFPYLFTIHVKTLRFAVCAGAFFGIASMSMKISFI